MNSFRFKIIRNIFREWRMVLVAACFSLAYLFLGNNLYHIQILKNSHYLRLAEAQNTASGTLKARRGNIYFTDKNMSRIPAVLNKEYPEIYAVPSEIQKEGDAYLERLAEEMSAITGDSKELFIKRFGKKNDHFESLAVKASEEKLEGVRRLAAKGIYIRNEISRFFPFSSLASHILGFVSPSADGAGEAGRYGVERYFNKLLSGRPGSIKENIVVEPENGQDLFLTIDRDIQSRSEEILRRIIEEYRAQGGTVIVQEPSTGRIWAMANMPDFDPNEYGKFDVGRFLNPAVEAVYEPGSIFKLMTMAAAIDSGKITPETTYYDSGHLTINGRIIKNWDGKARGKQTMLQVIENSINTGAVFAEKATGHDLFYNYLIKFGFNDITGIALPGEIKGDINNLKNGKDINFATASYGQGVSVTPLQLISAVSAIANGGFLMKPLILAEEKPKELRRVIREETAEEVKKMMVSAVYKNKIAVIPGYDVAGKTGTAFIPEKGGYSKEVINTYVGFAPASNPRFVVLIKLDKPEGSPLAGQTVTPAFRELAQFILNYLNAAPDKL